MISLVENETHKTSSNFDLDLIGLAD